MSCWLLVALRYLKICLRAHWWSRLGLVTIESTTFMCAHPCLPVHTCVCLVFLDYTIDYLSASRSAYLTDLSHSLDSYLAFRLEFVLKYSKVFLCTVTLLRLTLVMYLSMGNSPPVSARHHICHALLKNNYIELHFRFSYLSTGYGPFPNLNLQLLLQHSFHYDHSFHPTTSLQHPMP